MTFTIELNEELFEQPVKDAVARAVNQVVREQVNKFVEKYRSKVEYAVEVYLNKRLTDVEIKKVIDDAVGRLVEEKLRDNENWS